MKVLLVNPNLMKPPVTPVALDHLADALRRAGIDPILLDLAWSRDIHADIDAATNDDFFFAAVSVRNIDDSFFPGSDECLHSHQRIVARLQANGLKVAAGGVGFSIAPEQTLDFIGADYGIAGDGEDAIVALANALSGKSRLEKVPGLVGVNPPAVVELADMPASPRSFVHNARYLKEGGQVGFETKRGCSFNCAACADYLAKGRTPRLRNPKAVVDELKSLQLQDVDVLHTCDSEFNVPKQHAVEVCEELIGNRADGWLTWYAYCTPAGFDVELADLMRRAGCVGVDFAADHTDPEMLKSLNCPHSAEDLERAADACRKAGLRFMFDLLLGGPGETRRSLETTISKMRELRPTRVGVSLGIRLYPGCPIVEQIDLSPENPSLHCHEFDPSLFRPVYYRATALGDDIEEWLEKTIGGDRRFFFAASSHNYDDNAALVDLIRGGARGAFWDILARSAGD